MAAAALAGCVAPTARDIRPTDAPTTLTAARADADDLPRALLVALQTVEAALIDGAWEDGAYRARALLIESRPLRVSALPDGRGGYTLSAYVPPTGDAHAQRALVEAWRERLEQLHGVAWAPR